MKITFLGTCAGTEPMRGRRYSSLVVERNGALYWFDAGEGCSTTAHLAGIDLLATQSIFISHRHLDHIGGLPMLLWSIRKLNTRSGEDPKPLAERTLRIFIPDMAIWAAVRQMLIGYRDFDFPIESEPPRDGPIYEHAGLEVVALHNTHLGEPEAGLPWESFSYRIEADNKAVVYSGDVGDVKDVEPLLNQCDLLLMETGHHSVEAVCEYLKGSNKDFGKLGFVHHGRAILSDPSGELRKAKEILGDRVFLAEDGMEYEV